MGVTTAGVKLHCELTGVGTGDRSGNLQKANPIYIDMVRVIRCQVTNWLAKTVLRTYTVAQTTVGLSGIIDTVLKIEVGVTDNVGICTDPITVLAPCFCNLIPHG